MRVCIWLCVMWTLDLYSSSGARAWKRIINKMCTHTWWCVWYLNIKVAARRQTVNLPLSAVCIFSCQQLDSMALADSRKTKRSECRTYLTPIHYWHPEKTLYSAREDTSVTVRSSHCILFCIVAKATHFDALPFWVFDGAALPATSSITHSPRVCFTLELAPLPALCTLTLWPPSNSINIVHRGQYANVHHGLTHIQTHTQNPICS